MVRKPERSFVKPAFKIFCLGAAMSIGLAPFLQANPVDGQVTSGTASVAGQGTAAVTINQSSQTAIINWKSFSIGSGEVTKFIQPNSSSATLNRVLGGQTSVINGTLSANGQVFLINGNGILVGPGGVINTAGFTASTRDISDANFLSGNLHFLGNSDAGVQNLGTINAMGGDIYLIGKTVDNQGRIQASAGTVGLAAGDDVLLAQKNADGSTITVQATAGATAAPGKTGVSNSGLIQATSAELKAANGNIYALAINNSGSIRATTLKHQGGHIYLTSDSGTLVNSGTLDASATVQGGQGGTVLLKNAGGTTIHSGKIVAQGGQGGTGGNAEISGKAVQFTGTVDLTAQGGKTGNLLFDPENVTIQSTGSTTATGSGSPTDVYTGTSDDSVITVTDLENALATANITVTTGVADSKGSQAGDITVSDDVTWGSGNSLTLNAYRNINLNASLTNNGGAMITLRADNSGTGVGTVTFSQNAFLSTSGAVSIFYNPSVNPAGSEINQSSYVNPTEDYSAHVTGGGSLTAYMLVNTLNDLENVRNNLTGTYALGNDIDATATSNWNDGAGFIPIGFYDGESSSDGNAFQGTFNGQGYTINGIYINNPSSSGSGLFGDTGNSAVVENMTLTGVQVNGGYYSGGLVGVADGTFTNDSSSGVVSGTTYVGGLLGISYAAINSVSSAGSVDATGSGSNSVGGLIGYIQGGTLSNAYSTADVSVGSSSASIGGLVGSNGATISNSYSTGTISAGEGSSSLGGLVGENSGTIRNSFWDTDTAGSAISSGVGSGSSSGVTAATTAQLGSETFILDNARSEPTWDFTPGTGTWAISDGLPFLQGNSASSGSGSGPGTGTLPPLGTLPLATIQLINQVQAAQNDFARQASQPVIRLVEERIALASFSGDGINTGEAWGGALPDIGRGSFEGEMVTPANGFFGIVPGAVVTTPLPPGAVRQFEHAFDPGSLNELHHAAVGAP